MRHLPRIIRTLLVWAERIIRMIWTMMAVSVSSLWVGVPTARERISEDWTQRATDWGIGTIHRPQVKRIASVAALVVMIVIWVICAEITVLALRIIF